MGLKIFTAKEWSDAMGHSSPTQATQSHDAIADKIKRLLRYDPLLAMRWFGMMAGELAMDLRQPEFDHGRRDLPAARCHHDRCGGSRHDLTRAR